MRRSPWRTFVLAVWLTTPAAAVPAGPADPASQTIPPTVDADLGQVDIPVYVLASGRELAPGVYRLRILGEVAPAAAGPAGTAARVEFLRGQTIRGADLAILVSQQEMGDIAESAPPAPGVPRVELLKGGEYLRI